MRYTKPTPATKCETKGCDLMARILSMHDEPRKFKDGKVIDYDRTTKWRCDNGHLSETKSVFKPKPADPKTPARKRPTQKGYRHTANPNFKPTFRGGVTNHQRHVARRIQREQQAKMKVEAK